MFSERLRDLRNERGISQKELANILFVSQQTVAKWETDRSTPNPEMISKIAQYFNVSSDYLIGMSDTKSITANIPTDDDIKFALFWFFRRTIGEFSWQIQSVQNAFSNHIFASRTRSFSCSSCKKRFINNLFCNCWIFIKIVAKIFVHYLLNIAANFWIS